MSITSVNQQLTAELGFNYDRENGIVAGIYNGYHITFVIQNNLRQIIVSVLNGTGQIPKKGVLRQAHKEDKRALSNPSVRDYRATYPIPSVVPDKGEFERSAAAAAVFTEFLKTNYLRDCNELSSRPDRSSCHHMSGGPRFLTRDEYDTEHNRVQSSLNERSSKRGSPIAGTIGALIGSFAGLSVMVLVGQLDFISPWAGLVISVYVVKGYELPSGKFDTVGLVCSILTMVGMTYLSNQLDWAIAIARTYETDAFGALPVVNEVVKANELLPAYYHNLTLYYFATPYGAPPIIHGFAKNRQLLNVPYPIGLEAHESVVYVSSENDVDSG